MKINGEGAQEERADPERGNGLGIFTALNQLDRAMDAVRIAMADHRTTSAQAPPTAEQVRAVIKARQRRALIFAPTLFVDPAWELLLELYACVLEHQTPTIGQLTRSVGIPGSTVLRWLDTLDQQKLLTRQDDPSDSRKVRMGLSEIGKSRMDLYFAEKAWLPQRVREFD